MKSIKFRVQQTEQFDEYVRMVRKFGNKISSILHNKLKTKKILDVKGFKYTVPTPEEEGGEYIFVKKKLKYDVPVKAMTEKWFMDLPEVAEQIENFFPEDKNPQRGYIGGYIWQVAARYEGCFQRNKVAPTKKIDPFRASIDLKKCEINLNLETGEVKIRDVYGKGKKENHNYYCFNLNLSETFLGNLENFKSKWADKYNEETGFYENLNGTYIYRQSNKRELMILCEEVSTLPSADKFLGLDLNKKPENFLALSWPIDGKQMYSKNPELTECEQEIRKREDRIKASIEETSKREKTSQRKERILLRKQIKNWQRKQLRISKQLVNFLLDKAEEENPNKIIGLAIDTNSTGGKLGTYSHDSMRKAFKECANERGMTWYEVPAAYTTQHCLECGGFDSNARGRMPERFSVLKGESRKLIEKQYENIYSCLCGYEQDADIHAAKNHEARAMALQKNKVNMNNTYNKSIEIGYLSELKKLGFSPNK